MNKCNLVGDLLPQYAENMLSEDGKLFVERHLAHCPSCAEKAKKLLTPVEVEGGALPAEETARAIKDVKRRLKRRNFLTAAAACCVAAIVVFCAVYFPVKNTVKERTLQERARAELLYGPAYENRAAAYPRIVSHTVVSRSPAEGTGLSFTAETGETLRIAMPESELLEFLYPENTESWRVITKGNEAVYPNVDLKVSVVTDQTAAILYDRAHGLSQQEEYSSHATFYSVIHYYYYYGGSLLDRNQQKLAYLYLREAKGIGTYPQLAAFCFTYPLSETTVDSSYKDVLLARAVRECLWHDLHLANASSAEYFPIEGAATGFALYTASMKQFNIYLQGKGGMLWVLDFSVPRPSETRYFDEDADDLISYLEQISLS